MTGNGVEGPDRLGTQATAVALVGHGRVGEAVGEHYLTCLERGLYALFDVLGAGGEIEQDLGAGAELLICRIEEDGSDLAPDAGASGFGCLDHLASFGAEPLGEQAQLGGFAAAVGAFEVEEEA